MESLRLRTPEREHADLVLSPGVHAVGRDEAGRPVLVEDPDKALVQFCVDRRGVWLQLRDGLRNLHVNGRPVRRMAMLRAGDAIHIDGVELVLLGSPPESPPDNQGLSTASTTCSDSHMVLRGIGGLHHGRCVPLDQPRLVGRLRECDVRIDEPAFAERHARLEPLADGVILRDLGSDEGSVVNGHPARHALLRPGDQVVFDAQHRFVVEAPMRVDGASTEAASSSEAGLVSDADQASAADAVRSSAWRIPWLLLAALLLSAALSLLLLYGVR